MAKPLYTTDCFDTFIRVAEDCLALTGEAPQPRGESPTVATLQYAMIAKSPYTYSSDDVVFATSAAGRALDAKATKAQRRLAREAFFAKGQACLRASPLGKRFGWGIHADAQGRVAIYAKGSPRYQALAADPDITQVHAMRNRRG